MLLMLLVDDEEGTGVDKFGDEVSIDRSVPSNTTRPLMSIDDEDEVEDDAVEEEDGSEVDEKMPAFESTDHA